MKGWVYVISNQAMPGLIKIGYSTKDPELRAKELNHTGSPHPYIVEYEMLIDEPYRLEQQVHKALRHHSEGREWFRCSAEEAIAVIQRVAEGKAIHEVFKRAEREKAEQIRREREQAELRRRYVDALIAKQTQDIESEYRHRFETTESFKKYPFWMYWIASAMACMAGLAVLGALIFKRVPMDAALWVSVLGGAMIAHFVNRYVESKIKQSTEYKMFIQERDASVEQARKAISAICPRCEQVLRFDVQRLLEADNGTWNCPKCRTSVNPWQARSI